MIIMITFCCSTNIYGNEAGINVSIGDSGSMAKVTSRCSTEILVEYLCSSECIEAPGSYHYKVFHNV